jgi:uncharacterized protein (UPF0276 family)
VPSSGTPSIQLTTNLSDPLFELIRDNKAPIDAIEVGPWFNVRQIRDYRQALPDLPFYFHGADLIERVGFVPSAVRKIQAYLRCTDSPWVSMHITMWPPGMVWLMLRHRWRPPLPNSQRATRRFIWQVKRLARRIRVPVLLENTEALPFKGYHFEVEPQRIAEVLAKTDCGLVLDTGHARVSAVALGLDVYDYLSHLPLARVVQVHVSGPRMRNGRLVDVHETMQEVDYMLLDWVLARTQPRVVTLEYIRERDALREQLFRLREMLNGHNKKRAI